MSTSLKHVELFSLDGLLMCYLGMALTSVPDLLSISSGTKLQSILGAHGLCRRLKDMSILSTDRSTQ